MMRQLDHSALLPTRRSMKHCTASARVRLLAVPLVQPHPPPSFHQRRLCRCMRSLKAVPEGDVLGVREPVWVASPFKAASSPTSAERSREMSLVTSFGYCGPTYVTTGGAKRPCERTYLGGRGSP